MDCWKRTMVGVAMVVAVAGCGPSQGELERQGRAERRAAEAARVAALTPEQRQAEAREAARLQQVAREREELIREGQRQAKWESSARGACMLSIKRVLHDPDSAQFDRTSAWPVTKNGDGTSTVVVTLRASNAFGALRIGAYDCIVRPEGTNVRIINLQPRR